MIKYIKSVLWRVAKRLSYIEDARCLKVKRRVLINIEALKFHAFRMSVLKEIYGIRTTFDITEIGYVIIRVTKRHSFSFTRRQQ